MPPPSPTTPRQLILEWTNELEPVLDNFLAGKNVEVVAHLREFAAGRFGVSSLLLWGAPGGGKSHLLQATVAEARRRGRSAIEIRHEDEMDAAAAEAQALYALDDVNRLSPAGQGRLFTFYNACRDAGAQLLLAAAMPAARAPLRDDLRTRIGAGLILEVQPLADEDKPAALAAYAREQGFRLSAEVIDFLLTRGRRDMPTLLSNLRALDRYSMSTKRQVTVPLVKELLGRELATIDVQATPGNDAG